MNSIQPPVVVLDAATGQPYEIKNPRMVSKHGYVCPICRATISACHDAAYMTEMLILFDPDGTIPPETGFEVVA